MRLALRPRAMVTAFVLVTAVLPAAATGGQESPPDKSVVIDEISPGGGQGGPGGSGGFFELRNSSRETVELTGWSIYRCDEEGLRAKASRPEIDLTGVTLAPGERYTATHTGWRSDPADAVFADVLPYEGYGLVLLEPGGDISDSVAVYPSSPVPTESECGMPDAPAATAFALGESWQRTTDGWLRARATPGAANAVRAPAVAAAVRIDEVAPAGPAGHGDDFVELRNTGPEVAPLTGWALYRCTATGRLDDDTLQHRFGTDDALAPGERLVIGGPRFDGDAAVRTRTSLADLVSGVLLVDADGRRVDGVTVSSRGDTACQDGDERLAAELDHRAGESWQRTSETEFVIAARTPGEANVRHQAVVIPRTFEYPDRPRVAVSEFAADPGIPGATRSHFVELGNFGPRTVDISGWRIVACGSDGFRAFDDLAVVGEGTRLAPGRTWLAALAGTAAAVTADARFDRGWELGGHGVWIEDASGRRVDSVGVFHRNEMDDSVERASPCTKGLSLPTFGVDRLKGETWQRAGFSGDDASDFVAAPATPGVLADRQAQTPAALAGDALERAVEAAPHLPEASSRRADTARATLRAGTRVIAAFAGATEEPLSKRRLADEVRIDVAHAAIEARDDRYRLPYLRLIVEATGDGTVGWSGRTVGRATVRLSVWSPGSGAWRTLDEQAGERTARGSDADERIALSGRVAGREVDDGLVELLVQVVPQDDPAVTARPGIADAAEYDVALSHMTDTQYYSEVYADQVGWIAANADARKIAFSTHTGDLVQSWVDPDQLEERARREFEVASEMQAVLDDAAVPNSVLPGNHDNKRGVTNELFNEYFGPGRYADEDWYGASIAPGDNSANWSSFEAGGARFVMISLPYAYAEREIAWAETVVAAHADANIVISTHEHLTPKTDEQSAERSTSSRWVSHGDLLWERVVAPHRNVVLVLSGHFHGIGSIVTENAGGIPGHTVLEALADYQEFRTPTGERATGFQRLLQIDLGSRTLAVDTFSVALGATASHPYDYEQFVADDGHSMTASNERPWRVIERGLQHRYTEADDEFAVSLNLQHAKAVETDAVTFAVGDAGAANGDDHHRAHAASLEP
ncbi:lamin tail domain-containing protein [Microbacterium sp. HD4P20]|uniref:lamin tail domain-containing protein n=1 Tax=Microbacterium sp. HD4P20 TaxID=2864874 RepID=UPI001C6426EA|nr:lamin tail domain-containing protein [Microbacterium sp. HD4P20]MCP2636622.1 lamin tail domain-containing protein [Microbacterium sp. HD4P20]